MDQEHSLPGRTIRLRYAGQIYFSVGLYGCLGYFLVVGAVIFFLQLVTNLEMGHGLEAVLVASVVCGVVGGAVLFWQARGVEYCMNDEGIWFAKRGVTQWAINWSDLVLKSGGLLGARTKIALPNGKWRVLPGMLGPPGRDCAQFYALFRQRIPDGGRFSAAASGRHALISLILAAPAIPFAPKVRDQDYSVFDRLNDAGAWTGDLTSYVVLQIIVYFGMIMLAMAVFFGAHYFELKFRERRPKPNAALTELQEFRKAAFGHPLPVELELNVQYRYVAKAEIAKEIKEQRQVIWIVGLVLGPALLPGFWIGPTKLVLGAYGLLGLLILMLSFALRPMLAMRSSLGDTIIRTESGLTIIRDGISHQFPAEPTRKTRQNEGNEGTVIGTWWEEYDDGSARYRVDRRYLVPIDDEPA